MEVIGNVQFDSTCFLLLFVLIYLCYKFNFTLMLVIKIVVVDSLSHNFYYFLFSCA